MSKRLGLYSAIVKDNRDSTGMGRVRVFVPSLGGNPDDEKAWYVVTPAVESASNISNSQHDRDGQMDSQSGDSFGTFPGGYHIGNKVVVGFASGDPSKGYIIGSLFDEGGSSTVAGKPSGPTHDGDIRGVHAPVQEQNRLDKNTKPGGKSNYIRDFAWTKNLQKRGLYRDFIRGQITASPLRDAVSQFVSNKTPGGNSFIMDDGSIPKGGARPDLNDFGNGNDPRKQVRSPTTSSFMRLQGASGTSFTVADECGFIYMNSGEGGAWSELGENGMSSFAEGIITMRSKSAINFKANGDINIEVRDDKFIKANEMSTWSATGDFELKSDNNIIINSSDNLDIKSSDELNIEAGGGVSNRSGGDLTKLPAGVIHSNTSSYSVSGVGGLPGVDAESTEKGDCNDSKKINTTIAGGSVESANPSAIQSKNCPEAPSLAVDKNCDPYKRHENVNGDVTEYPAGEKSQCDPDKDGGEYREGGEEHQHREPKEGEIPGEVDIDDLNEDSVGKKAKGLVPNEDGYVPPAVEGNRVTSATGLRNTDGSGSRNHGQSLDIAPNYEKGTPATAVAMADGKVVDTSTFEYKGNGKANYGNTVTVQYTGKDGNTYNVKYAHLAEPGGNNWSVGDSVQQGQIIGYGSSSGFASTNGAARPVFDSNGNFAQVRGDHIHVEIMGAGASAQNRYTGRIYSNKVNYWNKAFGWTFSRGDHIH